MSSTELIRLKTLHGLDQASFWVFVYSNHILKSKAFDCSAVNKPVFLRQQVGSIKLLVVDVDYFLSLVTSKTYIKLFVEFKIVLDVKGEKQLFKFLGIRNLVDRL